MAYLLLVSNFVNFKTIKSSLREKCPYSEFFWSVFSCIPTQYGVSLHNQSEYGKIRTRRIPNTDTFHAVHDKMKCSCFLKLFFVRARKTDFRLSAFNFKPCTSLTIFFFYSNLKSELFA